MPCTEGIGNEGEYLFPPGQDVARGVYLQRHTHPQFDLLEQLPGSTSRKPQDVLQHYSTRAAHSSSVTPPTDLVRHRGLA